MTAHQIFEILESDCSYYIDLLKNCQKGHYLVRGYNYEIQDIKTFKHNLNNRKPRNMPMHIHDLINEHFLSEKGWKIRNGAFAYGFDMLNHKPKDLGYGPFALFFPIGKFEFAYNDEIFDLFGVINQLKVDVNRFIKNLKFESIKFCVTMNTKKDFDNFANETSIKTELYYLVNPKFAKDFAEKIWK